MPIVISSDDTIEREEVLALYQANAWSSAKKPDTLMAGLRHAHTLVTARDDGTLVGLANAISDGYLVVYYPHLLVLPDYRCRGIGRRIMEAMQSIYGDYHQQVLIADSEAVGFYKAMGFERAGKTEPMWIYEGGDH
jgi:GNAT superfamily N-acetyltransferase